MKTGFIPSIFTKIPVWIIIPVLLFVFNLIVEFDGLYGQDSFEYLRYSRALHEYMTAGALPGNFFWPVLYPLSGSLVSFLLPDILALQVISIVCYGLALFFIRKIVVLLYPGRTRELNWYLLLFYSLSPFIMRSSSVVMSDSMTLFFLTSFFYHYLGYKKLGTSKYFLLMVLFAFAAINTRYAAIIIVAIPAADALLDFFRKFNLFPFLLALFIAAVISLPDLLLKTGASHHLSDNILIPRWSVTNFFHRSFLTENGYLSFTFPNIFFVFTNLLNPGFIFPGLLFLFFLKRKEFHRPSILITVIVLIVYALFVAGLTTQNPRFLLLSFPCVIILFSGPFLLLWDIFDKRWKKLKLVLLPLIILTQMALFHRSFVTLYDDNRTVREIAGRIKAYPEKTIYTFNIDMGLRAYDVKNEIISLWSSRIDHFKPGSFILFNYVNSYRQWKGMNPVINWEHANQGKGTLLVEKLPGNWNLYEINN